MRSEETHDFPTSYLQLSSPDINGVVKYIKEKVPKRIVVMTGAGISTSAGIPDFRSPDTGLYANLGQLDLPYAEAVFDISYFREHPEPFYMLAKELYPGKFYPTISHAFIALLDRKGMLSMLYTQNIDCLERKAGVSAAKIVEAHGSFATQSCVDCKTQYPHDLMESAIEEGVVPYCNVPQCNGLVKPDIVFFGESLPASFFMNRASVGEADLLLVMGTSLSVQPFASLPCHVGMEVPRILINNEEVGDFGSRPNDVLILEDCDTGIQKLAEALGWKEELEKLWYNVSGKFRPELEKPSDKHTELTQDEILDTNIRKLIDEIDTSLKLSKEHTTKISKLLGISKTTEPVSNNPNQNDETKEEQPLVHISSLETHF